MRSETSITQSSELGLSTKYERQREGHLQPRMCCGAPIARCVGREIRCGVVVIPRPDHLKHPQDIYTVLHCNLTHRHKKWRRRRKTLFVLRCGCADYNMSEFIHARAM